MLNPPKVREYQIALDTIFLWTDIEKWTEEILKTKKVTQPILKGFIEQAQLVLRRSKDAFMRHDIEVAKELSEALKEYQKAARTVFQKTLKTDQIKALEDSYKKMKEEADYHSINFEPYFFPPSSKTTKTEGSFEEKIQLIVKINSITERGVTTLEALFMELNQLEESIVLLLNRLADPHFLKTKGNDYAPRVLEYTKSLVLQVLNWPQRHPFEMLIGKLELFRLKNTFELLNEQFSLLIHEHFKQPLDENICNLVKDYITSFMQIQRKMHTCLDGLKNHIEFLNDPVFSEIVEHIEVSKNNPAQPQEMIEFAKKSLIDRHRIFSRIAIFKEDSYSPGPNKRLNLLSSHSKPSLYSSLKIPFIHKDQIENIVVEVKTIVPKNTEISLEEVESELEQCFLCSILLKLLHDVSTQYKIEGKSAHLSIKQLFTTNFLNLQVFVDKILEGMILSPIKPEKIHLIHLFILSLDPLKIFPEISKSIHDLKIHRDFVEEYMKKNGILPISVEEYIRKQFMDFINEMHQKNKNLGLAHLCKFISLSSDAEIEGALLPDKSIFQQAENTRSSHLELLYQTKKSELRAALNRADLCNPSIYRDVLKNIELLRLICEDLFGTFSIGPATIPKINVPHIGNNSYRITSILLLLHYSPFKRALQEESLTKKGRLLLINNTSKIAPAQEKLQVYTTLKWLTHLISSEHSLEENDDKKLATANLLLADSLFLRALVSAKLAHFIDDENAYETHDPALLLEFILKDILGINLQIFSVQQTQIAERVRRKTNVAIEKPFIEISRSQHTTLQEAIDSTFSLQSSASGRTSISKRNNWLVTTLGGQKQIMGQPQKHLIFHLLPGAENLDSPVPALQMPDNFTLDLTKAHVMQTRALYKIIGFITRPSKNEEKYLLYLNSSENWHCLNGDRTSQVSPEQIAKIMPQGYIFLLEMI